MSFSKYFQEQQDADGERLWWPGGPAGFPFVGPQPPQTTKSEFDKLKLSGKARCRLFYLAKPEDQREYILVRDKCANGLFVLIDRDRVWDDESKHYRIYLEWIELGYIMPAGDSRDAIRNYTEQTTGEILPYSKLAGVRNNEMW